MNNWRYYETWFSPRWRINNDKTGMFFQTESEEWAVYLTNILNTNENA